VLDLESIRKKVRNLLDKERFAHSEAVEKVAAHLAEKWNVSVDKARAAALLHDVSRCMTPEKMLVRARELGIKAGRLEEMEPKLLHAELSSLIARDEFGVTDKDVLSAIEKHTIGSPGMSVLDKIVYLADHIEPGRNFSGVEKVRKLAEEDLERAIVASTSAMIAAIIAKGMPVHPGTVETRNYYLLGDSR